MTLYKDASVLPNQIHSNKGENTFHRKLILPDKCIEWNFFPWDTLFEQIISKRLNWK